MIKCCVVLVLGLAACDSPKKKAYEVLAARANPILEQMKPAAARLLALDPADHQAVVAACTSADEALWKLRDVKFDNEYVDTEPTDERVSSFAVSLLDNRKLICRDLRRHFLDECSEWCRGRWLQMIDVVERVHDAAAEEGVHIVSLRP